MRWYERCCCRGRCTLCHDSGESVVGSRPWPGPGILEAIRLTVMRRTDGIFKPLTGSGSIGMSPENVKLCDDELHRLLSDRQQIEDSLTENYNNMYRNYKEWHSRAAGGEQELASIMESVNEWARAAGVRPARGFGMIVETIRAIRACTGLEAHNQNEHIKQLIDKQQANEPSSERSDVEATVVQLSNLTPLGFATPAGWVFWTVLVQRLDGLQTEHPDRSFNVVRTGNGVTVQAGINALLPMQLLVVFQRLDEKAVTIK